MAAILEGVKRHNCGQAVPFGLTSVRSSARCPCSVLLVVPGYAPQSPAPILPVVYTKAVEVKAYILVPCIDRIPTVPVSLAGADLLVEPNGVGVDRPWWVHIQRWNWEKELMALLSACVARPVHR